MAIVTLTTDLGLSDYYVGSLKGALLSEFPDLTLVDISHQVEPFDILRASILIRNAYRDFPEGTVHIIGVNPEADEDTEHLVAKVHGQFFLFPNNGIYWLIFDVKADEIVSIDLVRKKELITFPAKDIYVKAACHVARGGPLQVIGKPVKELRERALFRAVSEDKLIRGMAVYIDHYGNVITNIHEELFKQFRKMNGFSIQLRRSEYEINEINDSYNEVPQGEKLALFSSSGYLEIAINQGNASRLLGIKQNDIIRIEFYDH